MSDKIEDKLDSTLNYSIECAALNMSLDGGDGGKFGLKDDDSSHQLKVELSKFIELVPHLKQINNKNNNILCSSSSADSGSSSITQGLHNLELTSKSSSAPSDLQILQSILDYITDLQEKVYN